ncbi:MAG: hypothetical protein GON13_03385 [Nanoarchaeota archaeon]|nr:hypothetical protein [Nanoarchaeota archaeon]
MRRAQIQIPLLLLLILGLFILYLLWINPSERAKILNINTTSPISTNPDNSVSVDNVVFSNSIGYIGRSTGDAVGNHFFDSVSLAYPLINESILEKSTAVLTANILLKGSTKIVIPNDYSSVLVKARIGEVVGTPNLEIKSANTLLYKSAISKNQNINLVVDADKMVGDSLEVSCQWRGLLFWQSQKCELLDFEIVKQYFSNINVVEVFDFTVSSIEAKGNNFKLCFKVTESDNSGSLSVNFNDVQIYSASPIKRDAAYCVKDSVSVVDLNSGVNIVEFSSSKGGVYDLSDVSLIVYETSQEASNKTLYFSVPSSVYDDAESFVFQVSVDEIIEAGYLEFIVGNTDYVFNPGEIFEGLLLVDIDKEDVKSGTNKLRVESSSGRFKIGNLKMLWS